MKKPALVFFFVVLASSFALRAQTGATFAKRKIRVAAKAVMVEIADSNEKRSQGLMFRDHLGNDSGMLFVFDDEQPLAFWMKNTLIPLAIGYYDREKKLIDIQEMEPAIAGDANPKTYKSKQLAMFALEMPKGWFAKNKIGVGTKFDFLPEPKKSKAIPSH